MNSNLDYESDIETEWVTLLDSLYTQLDISIESVLTGETKTDAKQYSQRLGDTIRWIKENPRNWIVSEIVYDEVDKDKQAALISPANKAKTKN